MLNTVRDDGLNSFPLDLVFFTSVIPKNFGILSPFRTKVIHNPRSGLVGNDDRMNIGSSEMLLLDSGADEWLVPFPMWPASTMRLRSSSDLDKSFGWIMLKILVPLSFFIASPVSARKAAEELHFT